MNTIGKLMRKRNRLCSQRSITANNCPRKRGEYHRLIKILNDQIAREVSKRGHHPKPRGKKT